MMKKYEEGVPLEKIAASLGIDIDACRKEIKATLDEWMPPKDKDKIGKIARNSLANCDRIEAECAKALLRCPQKDKRRFEKIANDVRKMRAGPISHIVYEEAKQKGLLA